MPCIRPTPDSRVASAPLEPRWIARIILLQGQCSQRLIQGEGHRACPLNLRAIMVVKTQEPSLLAQPLLILIKGSKVRHLHRVLMITSLGHLFAKIASGWCLDQGK